MRVIALLLVVALSSEAGEKKKQPKPLPPPTQPDIVKECLTVTNIHSYTHKIFAGAHIEADAINSCAVAIQVSITIAYYNRNGVQFADGYSSAAIAPGTTWHLWHRPIMEVHETMWRSGKIVNVLAYALR